MRGCVQAFLPSFFTPAYFPANWKQRKPFNPAWCEFYSRKHDYRLAPVLWSPGQKEPRSRETGKLCIESLSGVSILVTAPIDALIGQSDGKLNYWLQYYYMNFCRSLGWTDELPFGQCLRYSIPLISREWKWLLPAYLRSVSLCPKLTFFFFLNQVKNQWHILSDHGLWTWLSGWCPLWTHDIGVQRGLTLFGLIYREQLLL